MSRRLTILALGLILGAAPMASWAASEKPAEASGAGKVVVKPDWLRRPNGKDLISAYPAPNRQNRDGGSAVIKCLVTAQGALERCEVLGEKPEGSGFGGSALLLAPAFRMRPMMVDGKAVGGAEVRVPFNFGPVDPAILGSSMRVLSFPPWLTTPTPAQVAAAYPANAAALESGHVGMRCKLTAEGRLKACEILDSGSAGASFAAAARKLTPFFQVAIDMMGAEFPSNVYVNLAIDFPNPRKPHPPLRILQPNWMALPEPEDVKAVFPEKARTAKVATGAAMLRCTADHAGYLTNCTVEQETPVALGFGEAAISLSEKLRVNPWTASGSPTDGALITLPLRLAE